MIKVACLLGLVGVAVAMPVADSPPPPYGPPAPYHPEPYHPEPAYHPEPVYPHHEKKEEPKPYKFDYGVQDDYTATNFGHSEDAKGDGTVTGEYRVALPDGRTQIVKYVADHYNGFQAEVTYEGEAVYPEYNPAPPSYGPPAYGPPEPYAPPPYSA